jgi:hypothetical protein
MNEKGNVANFDGFWSSRGISWGFYMELLFSDWRRSHVFDLDSIDAKNHLITLFIYLFKNFSAMAAKWNPIVHHHKPIANIYSNVIKTSHFLNQQTN